MFHKLQNILLSVERDQKKEDIWKIDNSATKEK
jgi:hypothetical protein